MKRQHSAFLCLNEFPHAINSVPVYHAWYDRKPLNKLNAVPNLYSAQRSHFHSAYIQDEGKFAVHLHSRKLYEDNTSRWNLLAGEIDVVVYTAGLQYFRFVFAFFLHHFRVFSMKLFIATRSCCTNLHRGAWNEAAHDVSLIKFSTFSERVRT